MDFLFDVLTNIIPFGHFPRFIVSSVARFCLK